MREINKSKKPFDFGIVMSNTSWEGSFDYVPPKYIFEEFNENVLKNLIKIQKDNLQKKIASRKPRRERSLFMESLEKEKPKAREKVIRNGFVFPALWPD
jgi:hypothetical protein